MKFITLATAAVAVLVLSGCMPAATESGSSTAESYQYKGKADPLLAQSASERAATLSERFKLVQARQ